MSHINTQNCPCCREIKLIDVDKAVIQNGKKYTCLHCKNKKSENYYLENNLHPLWYECDSSGKERIVNGKKFVGYDFLPQLTDLTIDKKLLI